MTKQKSGFWTFIFSLIPGAGEMYMGFRKQGISIMSIFWLVIALSATLNLGLLMVAIPIIWFYSFFNVHNLKSLSEEEFYAVEDSFVLGLEGMLKDKENWIRKYRNLIAAALIIIGCFILWNTLISVLYSILPSFLVDIVYRIGNFIPRVLVALIIIYIGIYLVRGKKKELEFNEDA